MSIPRKRGKVKSKKPAAKKRARKKTKVKKPRLKARKKVKAKPKPSGTKAKKRPAKRIGNIRVSVTTKPPRQPVKKTKKRKKKRRLSPRKLEQLIDRTIAKTAREAGVSELEIRVRVAGGSAKEIREAAFFSRPDVKLQVAERMVEKGLMDLTRGMVRTQESLILAELILGEQRGDFDDTAKRLAEQFGLPLREIYTLWHSPDSWASA